MLDQLTRASFDPHCGTTFDLDRGHGEPLALELIATHSLGGDRHEGQRQPFSVLFRGPGEPLLPQRIYPLDHPALGRLELFLVPIGQDAAGVRYEAVFT